jgi:hypothetical protein
VFVESSFVNPFGDKMAIIKKIVFSVCAAVMIPLGREIEPGQG